MKRLLVMGFALLAACGAHAGTNSWTSIGLPEPLFAYALEVDPTNANVMFVSQPVGPGTHAIYRTLNGGNDWTQVFTSTWEFTQIAIDPANPSLVWAVRRDKENFGGAAYKSVNGGTDWTLKNFGLVEETQRVAIDPVNPGTVYALAGGNLYRTVNGGDAWTNVATPSIARAVAVDPANGNVLLGTDTGIHRSTNGGVDWTEVAYGTSVRLLVFEGTNGVAYAGPDNLFKSADGGASWTNLNPRFLGPHNSAIQFEDLAVAPGSPSVLMVSIGTCGMYKSLDGGLTFTDANAGLDVLSPDTHCYYSSARQVVHSPAAPTDFFANFSSSPFASRYTLDATLLAPTCSIEANPPQVTEGGSSTLTAYCSPAATSYVWSSNTGFASSASGGTVSPVGTTTYTVQGVNAAGTGGVASVTVVAPGPRLINLSTRAQVLTGNDVMIAGFVLGGTSAKTILVRARGPSLESAGITNFLVDPTMRLHSGTAILASNDDWQSATNAADVTASGFAPSHPQESAILRTMNPGSYTAIVEGVGGSTGVAIVEVFEVGQPEIPFANISTRAHVFTGNDIAIGGFVVSGSEPKTVVVRARGPSLAPFGIANALANPTLQLVRSSDQTVIATNDDWQSAANAPEVQSRGFAPDNSLESAILITLQPGAYTAIMSGVGGGTGIGIVEVFAQ